MMNIDGMALVTKARFYQPGDLVVIDCKTGEEFLIEPEDCYGACFSPDGTRAAYCKDGTIYVSALDGTGKDELTKVTGFMNLNWISDGWIYFTQLAEKTVYRVNVISKVKEVLFTSNKHVNALSISQDGKHAVWSQPTYIHGEKPIWKVIAWNLKDGKEREIADGANAAISSDGEFIIHTTLGLQGVSVRSFSDGSEIKVIQSSEYVYNRLRFSLNSEYHFVHTVEPELRGYVYNLEKNESCSISNGGILHDYYSANKLPGRK